MGRLPTDPLIPTRYQYSPSISPISTPSQPPAILFMPIEQDPVAYYHIYLASQQRVERWVAETDKHLQASVPTSAPVDQAAPRSNEAEKRVKPRVAEREPMAATTTSRPRTSRRSPSSKHPTHESGRSRSRPSTGSKRVKGDRAVRHSSGAVAERSSTRSRTAAGDPSLSSYLPYGILPLLLAVIGTSALSVILAGVLLVGYSLNVGFVSYLGIPRAK